MTNQIIAYGAVTERSANGSTGWETIPECKGIAVPTVETDYIDVTNFDSPNGFKEYLPGLKDAGVINVNCGYTSAGYDQTLTDQASGLPIYYRTTLKPAPGQSTGDIFVFQGYPTPQVSGDDVAGVIGMTIVIRTTGDVTWTAGS